MSRESMEINFQQSLEVAGTLEELAGILTRVTENDFQELLLNIRRCWEGAAAEEFLKRGDTLCEKLKQSAAALTSGAQMVRQTAQKIYQAEQQAIIIAQERKYR